MRSSRHFELEEVRPGAWAVLARPGRGAYANAAIVDLGGRALVVDTHWTHQAAADLRTAAESLAGPIAAVVNTHWHQDHVYGNSVFDRSTVVTTTVTRRLMATIGVEELRLLQEEDADEYFGELREKIAAESDAVRRAELTNELSVAEEVELCRAALEIRLPDATLDGKLVLEGRARTVEVLSLGGGHTESDTIVFLPDERLLITGDLVVVDAHPWVGHGNVPDWLRILDGLEELDACVIVPGHGPATGAGAVDEVRAYLADLLEAAATDEAELPERYRSWTHGSVFERNVDAVRAGP